MKNPFKNNLMRSNSAFTLMELMIVIGIIGILSAVAVPSVISWRNNAQFNSAVRMVKSAIESTRMNAIKSNMPAQLNFIDGGTTFMATKTFGNLIAHQLPPGVILASSTFAGNGVQFNSRGMPVNNIGGTVNIQNNSGTLSLQIIISSSGVSRIN